MAFLNTTKVGELKINTTLKYNRATSLHRMSSSALKLSPLQNTELAASLSLSPGVRLSSPVSWSPEKKKCFKTSDSFLHVTDFCARVTAALIRPGWLSAAPPWLLVVRGKKNRKKDSKYKTTHSLVSYIIIQIGLNCTSVLDGISQHFKILVRSWRGRKKKGNQQTRRWKTCGCVFFLSRNCTWVFGTSGLSLPELQCFFFPSTEG